MKINLSKYKRFKDGGCAYSENTGSSHLNGLVLTYLLVIACFKLLCAHIRLTLSHIGTTLAFGEVLEDDEKTDEGHC